MEEIQNDPKPRKGGVIMLLLFLLILFFLGEIIAISSFHRKATALRNQLAETQEKQKSLREWKRKAVLSADALSALRGWKSANPLASFFLEKLQASEEGLTLDAFFISRCFVPKPLPKEDQEALLPHPIRPFFLFDYVEFSISETHSGSGVLTFPRFRSRLNKGMKTPLGYERTSSASPYADTKNTPPPPNLWSFFSDFPAYPLWENVLKADQ